MAKTLENLRDHARVYLDEATQADWTDIQINRETNYGYMRLYTEVVNVYEDYYSEKSNADTLEDQQEYTLPTDLYKLRRVEVDYQPDNSNSIPRRARPIPMDAVLRDLAHSTAGITVLRNPAYYVRGTTIGFIPAPSQNGTDAITYWYIKTVDELSDDDDAIDIPFPDRYGYLIALSAAAQLLRKGQQEEIVASRYLLEFEEGLRVMRADLEDRLADDTKEIVDVIGNDTDFSNYSQI